jgi:hypothetical protein
VLITGQQPNTGLTNTDVRALAIDPTTPSTLYAGTGGGVFVIQQIPLLIMIILYIYR